MPQVPTNEQYSIIVVAVEISPSSHLAARIVPAGFGGLALKPLSFRLTSIAGSREQMLGQDPTRPTALPNVAQLLALVSMPAIKFFGPRWLEGSDAVESIRRVRMGLPQFVVGSSSAIPPSKIHAIDDVHVWIIDVSSVGSDWIRRRYGLNGEERAKAERFRSACDASRFVVRRAALRIILGAMAECGPTEVKFGHGSNGKPRAILPSPIDLRFNSTSSHNLVLIAASVGLELGIDVECIVPTFDFSAISRDFFSACERRTVDALPASLKLRASYRAWTSKEAILKALGIGLSGDLAGISVEVDPRQPQDLLFEEGQNLWCLCALDTLPDYMAALVVPAACRRVIMHRWCPAGAPDRDDQPPPERA